jgi:hypothetical protein
MRSALLAGAVVALALLTAATPAHAAMRDVCKPSGSGVDLAFVYKKAGKIRAYASWYPAWAASCPIREVRVALERYRWWDWDTVKEPYFPSFPVYGEAVYGCGAGDGDYYQPRVTFVYSNGAPSLSETFVNQQKYLTCG